MSTPPGRAGVDGPITGRKRAILTARLGALRLGVGRLGFAPVDTQSASDIADGGAFYVNWRDDPAPPEYGDAYSGTAVVR